MGNPTRVENVLFLFSLASSFFVLIHADIMHLGSGGEAGTMPRPATQRGGVLTATVVSMAHLPGRGWRGDRGTRPQAV
ncbi:hypothetical protein CHELA1G11_11465 [Hyphomicrobiales bacterium]|nr:hypothetical protein CHELA1G11_11465 [Hyphomicrobiales bacterium]CAH1667575.1 hypothetical protein CHELA1G2_12844 [Hyphomicrobiales bacterium]